MKIVQRLTALALALVLVVGLLPPTARAEENQVLDLNLTYINPLYADVITEEDLISYSPPVIATYDLDNIAETAEEAAAQLREQMTCRATSTTIHVLVDTLEQTELQDMVLYIFDLAIAHTGVPTEGDYLRWQYAGLSVDNAQLYGTNVDGIYALEIPYAITYYTTAEQEAEMDDAVDSLLAELNVSGKSDYQKVKAIYDYICANVIYDEANQNDSSYTLKFTAYAALINGTAVCQGYANLLYRLALELGVDSRLISGDGGGPHGWNIVELNNLYYNVDSTWDAQKTEYDYFLKSDDSFTGHIRDDAYCTESFYAEYPMSETDYAPPVPIASGTCGEDLTWELDNAGTLTISGAGAMADFCDEEAETAIDPGWADYKDTVKAVNITEGVTTIGSHAFSQCFNLSDVSIPDSVTKIGSGAFEYCAITSISLPNSVTEIGQEAFTACTALKEITFPNQLTVLSSSVFSGCTSLTNIIIPDNITALEGYTFNGCTNLQSVTLSNKVSFIGEYTFSGCSSLASITIPASAEKLGMGVFSDCIELIEVTFEGSAPTFLTEIGENEYAEESNAFSNVTATVRYPAGNPTWTEDVMLNYGGSLTWKAYCPGDHVWDEGTVTTEPTEEAAGTMLYTCTVCGETREETIPVLEHTHSYTAVVTDPTCTEDGYTTYTCSCGDSYTADYVEALGHSWDEGTVTREPTANEPGIVTYECKNCDESYTEEIPYEAPAANVLRVSGGTRYETSFAIAEQLKDVLGVKEFDTIIVASGESYPDALSGSYLSTTKNAPILLTNKSMNNTVLTYIKENLSSNGMVYILGGVNSVTQSFEDSLNDAGIENKRLSGATRVETNLAILEEVGVKGDKILISTAYNYADTLSASASGLPILLLDTNANKLTDAQKVFLEEHSDCELYIVGGVNTVSEKLAAETEAYGAAERISGGTREETSIAVASFIENPECVVLAYSRNYPDGLCGGVLAYNLKAPVILTNVGAEDLAAAYVEENGISEGVILGGVNSVKDESVRTIFSMASDDTIDEVTYTISK